MKKKLLSILTVGSILLCSLSPVKIYADSQRIITLGVDLDEDQRQTVLKFFGVVDDLTGIEVIDVNNQEEHEVLDGVVADSVIGTHTFSCAYIEPTVSGGINIKTANLTYVTPTSLYNALQTAGVENCNLIVTAPFPVSGTGALTGVFKAYKNIGQELDENKKDLAAEELVLDSQLEADYGEESSDLVIEVKEKVAENESNLTKDEIKDIVDSKAQEHDINLSSEDVDKLVNLVDKFQNMEYDTGTFKKKLDELQNEVTSKLESGVEEFKGFFAKIADFFKSIFDFFANLFGGGNSDSDTEEVESSEQQSSGTIFDNVNTDIFSFDTDSSGDAVEQDTSSEEFVTESVIASEF